MLSLDLSFKNLYLKGELYALSLDTRIDSDDCVAITPCGKLHLSLNKETYQCLGLDGKLSYFSRKHQDRYGKFFHFIIESFDASRCGRRSMVLLHFFRPVLGRLLFSV